MRGRTPVNYPKEGDKKLKETIQVLKSRIRHLTKENKWLRAELENVMKPVRTRKKKIDRELTHEEWRKKFVRELKEDLAKREEK